MRSMQKTLYEILGVSLHSNINQQALEPMHKSLVHDGLQLETLVTLKDVVGEVIGGQNNETSCIVINWGLPTTIDGNTSTTMAHEV